MIISALTQLQLAGDLDRRDCLDHCAYVLVRNNCDSKIHLNACIPRSRAESYIKSMIDAKVFPSIERCQLPLIDRALQLNVTIEPRLYSTVSVIMERLLHFVPTRSWSTIEDIILTGRKPFTSLTRLIRPQKSNFLKRILDTLIFLDTQHGQHLLRESPGSGILDMGIGEDHFRNLVLEPCRDYAHKMHKAMDAAIYYGRITELDNSKFELPYMSDEKKIGFFQLVLRYQACVTVDNKFDNSLVKNDHIRRRIRNIYGEIMKYPDSSSDG